MPTWLTCICIVALSGALDFLALKWTAAAAAGKAYQATLWAVCVEVCALLTVYGALSSWLVASSAVLGSALGTFVSVKLKTALD